MISRPTSTRPLLASPIVSLAPVEFGIGDRIVGTTRVTGEQWLVCIVFAFGMLLIDEVIKFFMRRRGEYRDGVG